MVGADVESKMVANLCLPQSTYSVKRLDCLPEPLSSTVLASCFTERATVIFNVLQLNEKEKAQRFPSKDREEWCDDPSYQALRMALSTTTVMNDSSERATALTQQYNMPLTKNEEQR